MNWLTAFGRETKFMLRDRSVLTLAAIVVLLSVFALWSGLEEVSQQRASIEQLIAADRADRQALQARQDSWGGAAYYSFHLTFDPPSDFAFAALGQRDKMPWRHRIRMLALEGQIHERDPANPMFALIGRLDFAFLLAFVLPLLLIALLYDLRTSERAAGRYELLSATAGKGAKLWPLRAWLRTGLVAICALVPLWVAGLIAGAAASTLFSATVIVLAYLAFWTFVCTCVGAWRQNSTVILASLTGVWILLAVVLPAGGRLVVDRLVAIPSGAELIMSQREAVNTAWDLPKEATMEPFLKEHPQFAEFAKVERPFEWKWYYALQQVGDQKTAPLSTAYRHGVAQRDRLAARWALLSPPALVERSLQALADTNLRAALAYEEAARDFHAELRNFYYPKLFRDEPFDLDRLVELPNFVPAGDRE